MIQLVLHPIKLINKWLEKAIYFLAIVIVANMVLALTLSALVRYVSGTGYDWFIELPPVLTSWLVFPLLGPLLKTGQHIKVDVLTIILGNKQLSFLRTLIFLISLLASVVFFVAGWEAMQLYRMLGQVMELEIEIPIWWVYLAFPTGFFILALFSFELLLEEILVLIKGGNS